MGLLLELAQGRANDEERRPAPRDYDQAPAPTTGRSPAELLALVERVGRAYRASPADMAEMKRLALTKPEEAWECFFRTIQLEGIH